MDRSRPKEHAAENRMPKFVLVWFLGLVKNRRFRTYRGLPVLLLLLRKTLIPHNSKTIGRTSMKFGMQLSYGNALG